MLPVQAFFRYDSISFITWLSYQVLTMAALLILCRGGQKKDPGQSVWRFRFSIVADGGILLIVLTMTSLFLFRENSGIFVAVWPIVLGLVTAVYIIVRCPWRRICKVAAWSSLFAIMQGLSAFAGVVSFLLNYFVESRPLAAAVQILIFALSVPFSYLLLRFNFDEMEEIPHTGLVWIILNDAVLLILCQIQAIVGVEDMGNTIIFTVIYLCAVPAVLASTFLLYRICKEQEELLLLRQEHQKRTNEEKMAELIEKNLQDLREARHDMKNRYAYLDMLAGEGRYDELKQYLKGAQENLLPAASFFDCGNSVLNRILNLEISRMQAAGIAFEHQLVVPPRLPFPDDDVISLFMNLMDNALDECNRLMDEWKKKNPDHGPCTISLDVYPKNTYLYIVCRNTTDRTTLARRGSALKTTKKNRLEHGYGTQIVTRIAERYNGCADFSLVDGYFVAKVLLDCLCEEEDK